MKKTKFSIFTQSKKALSLLKEILNNENYELQIFNEKTNIIEEILKGDTDVVILDCNDKKYDAYNICRIIKSNPQHINIKCILCTTNKTKNLFLLNHSKCDEYLIISEEEKTENKNKIHELLLDYEDLLELEEIESDNPEEKEEIIEKKNYETLIKNTMNLYREEFFNLELSRNALTAYNYIFDLDALIKVVFNDFLKLFDYDAIGILINETPLLEFYDKVSSISDKDLENFKLVCHSDFEKRFIDKTDFKWESSIIKESTRDTKRIKTSDISTYEIFPTQPVLYPPISIHVACCKKDAISDETRLKLNQFTKLYTDLITKSLLFRKSNLYEEKMHRTLKTFLPAKIIDNYIDGNKEIHNSIGEQRDVAILIADIRNFTAITEKIEPENTVSFLNMYFSKMGNIIQKHGGIIDKFMGDAIMALFGAIDSYDNNGKRAAIAAIEMQEEIKNLDTSILQLNDDEEFKVGIGIHYGTPVVGSIGSNEKKEFTVIGDDVNLAARIESLTKLYGASIIITQSVKDDIFYNEKNKEMLIRHLDNVKVKGKSITQKVYELGKYRNKYPETFLQNYQKGLMQYIIGNFNGAIKYLKKAEEEVPEDLATKVLIERCIEYEKNKPSNWNGSVSLMTK